MMLVTTMFIWTRSGCNFFEAIIYGLDYSKSHRSSLCLRPQLEPDYSYSYRPFSGEEPIGIGLH